MFMLHLIKTNETDKPCFVYIRNLLVTIYNVARKPIPGKAQPQHLRNASMAIRATSRDWRVTFIPPANLDRELSVFYCTANTTLFAVLRKSIIEVKEINEE